RTRSRSRRVRARNVRTCRPTPAWPRAAARFAAALDRADRRSAARAVQVASALAALLFLTAIGCRRPAPPSPPPAPPGLGTIAVQLGAPDDGAAPPVDVEAVRTAVGARLLATAGCAKRRRCC